MVKRVPLTESLKEHIRQKTGGEIDFSKIVLYQSKSLTSEPVNKKGSIFDGAVHRPSVFEEMKAILNNPETNTPIQALHEDHFIPYGRIVHSELVREGNLTSIYTTWMISTSHEDLVDKIDTAIIDEVSFQFKARKGICSACDYDYYGEDFNIEAWLTHTCPNGHTIGVDGVHLEMEGCDYVTELSLVPQGAAKNPKILSVEKQITMSKGAGPIHSFDKEQFMVQRINSKLSKGDMMTLEEALKALAEKDAKIAELMAQNEALTADAEEAKAKAEADSPGDANAEPGTGEGGEEPKKEDIPAEEPEAPVQDPEPVVDEEKEGLKKELEDTKAELEEKNSFISGEVRKILIASGTPEASIPEDLEGVKALLKDRQAILAMIPVGGVAKGADADLKGQPKLSEDLSAFKINKGDSSGDNSSLSGFKCK